MSLVTTILTYFFSPIPSGKFKFMILLIVLAAAALLCSIALRFYLKQQKEDKIFRKLFRDLPGKLQLVAILEGIYIFARYEQMAFLSMRITNYIILGTGLYLIIRSAQTYFQVYPAEKKRHLEQLHLNKYLPRKGHKKH